MIVSTLNKKGKIQRPYILLKERNSPANNPEGKWNVWMYSHKVIVDNETKFKYHQVRYDGVPARFKTKDDAREFALYRVGL